MTTIEIIDKLVVDNRAIDEDYLTQKELDRRDAFIDKMYRLEKHYPDEPRRALLSEINGFKTYLISLKLKVIKRENIPRWYIDNKI